MSSIATFSRGSCEPRRSCFCLLPHRELDRGGRLAPCPTGRDRATVAAARSPGSNLIGSVFFGFSAIASVVLKTGEQVNLEAATWFTFAGAVCFLVGAYLLVPRRVSS